MQTMQGIMFIQTFLKAFTRNNDITNNKMRGNYGWFNRSEIFRLLYIDTHLFFF